MEFGPRPMVEYKGKGKSMFLTVRKCVLLCGLFLGVPNSSVHAVVSIEDVGDGKFERQILATDTCGEFITEYRALRSWSNLYFNRLIGDVTKEDCPTFYGAFGFENKYSMNMEPFLPIKISKDVGNRNCIEGPNCYGTTMFAVGAVRYLGFVNREEFSFLLRSPLCRKLASETELVSGDIIHYSTGPSNVSMHSNVFISSNILFNKSSPKTKDRFGFVDRNTAETLWSRKLNDRTFYHCSSAEKHFKSITIGKGELSVLVNSIFGSLAQLEQTMEMVLFCTEEEGCNTKRTELLKDEKVKIEEELDSIKKLLPPDGATKAKIDFFADFTIHRLSSITDMIDMPEVETKNRTKTRMRFDN